MSALGRLVQWRIRTSALRAIPVEAIRKGAYGVPARAFVSGTPSFKGISSKHLNRFKVDMVLSNERFLLVSNRGTLIDLNENKGLKFRSVRSTGPQRLVIEGDLPGISNPGEYRFELVLADALEWATALGAWVDASGAKAPFGQPHSRAE